MRHSGAIPLNCLPYPSLYTRSSFTMKITFLLELLLFFVIIAFGASKPLDNGPGEKFHTIFSLLIWPRFCRSQLNVPWGRPSLFRLWMLPLVLLLRLVPLLPLSFLPPPPLPLRRPLMTTMRTLICLTVRGKSNSFKKRQLKVLYQFQFLLEEGRMMMMMMRKRRLMTAMMVGFKW